MSIPMLQQAKPSYLLTQSKKQVQPNQEYAFTVHFNNSKIICLSTSPSLQLYILAKTLNERLQYG
jgi:hypothetical protein